MPVVTAAWSSNVLPRGRVLPAAGAPRCGAPAPKLAGGKRGAATMTVREPILKDLLVRVVALPRRRGRLISYALLGGEGGRGGPPSRIRWDAPRPRGRPWSGARYFFGSFAAMRDATS
jgi:hypothetical protein